MRCVHQRIFLKPLPRKLTETLNASIFVSSFLNFFYVGVFLFTTMVYVQGAKWKKLLIDSNEYQGNTIGKYRLSVSEPQTRESCFALSLNYAGLCKEHSSKQATDNFQHRALLRKIVETLKKSIFSFIIVNLVKKAFYTFLLQQACN